VVINSREDTIDSKVLNPFKKAKVRSIGIIGAGTLGTQITAHLLYCGCDVILKTRSPDKIEQIASRVTHVLDKYPNVHVEKQIANFEVVTDYEALNICDAVIEAVVEDVQVKKEVLASASHSCPDVDFFFTNSSSICIDNIAPSLRDPSSFLGYHLFNPVYKMRLVEIVIGDATGEKAISAAMKVAELMDKDAVIVQDSPGFIVNRLLLRQINDAARMLEQNVSTIEDIDKAVRLGLNHPLGPFQLADLIGLDVCLSILRSLEQSAGWGSHPPSPLIEWMVAKGKLGRKSGEGFYKYSNGN
jgi:3-hydroxybutyryl-CoA dehydrogenase